MFPVAYQADEISFCIFTKVKRVEITLRGELFPHLLFHYRLAWSGWAYGQVIHGGECFVTLSEGCRTPWLPAAGFPASCAPIAWRPSAATATAATPSTSRLATRRTATMA
jgi:hypothetical protein